MDFPVAYENQKAVGLAESQASGADDLGFAASAAKKEL